MRFLYRSLMQKELKMLLLHTPGIDNQASLKSLFHAK